MGYCFQQLSGMNPFVIDQIRSVNFTGDDNEFEVRLLSQFPEELTKHGGTMGFLREEIPSSLPHFHMLGADAFLLSNQNEME